MCDKGVKEGWAGDGGVGRSACAISDGRMWDGGKQTLAGVSEVGAGALVYSAACWATPSCNIRKTEEGNKCGQILPNQSDEIWMKLLMKT